jgi:hypothetical protein
MVNVKQSRAKCLGKIDTVTAGNFIAASLPSAITRPHTSPMKQTIPHKAFKAPKLYETQAKGRRGCHNSSASLRWPTHKEATPLLNKKVKKIRPAEAKLGLSEKGTHSNREYNDQQHEFHHVTIPARTKTAESGGIMELNMHYRSQLPFLGTDTLDAIGKLKPFNTRTSVVGSTSDLARAIHLHVRTNKTRSLKTVFSKYDRNGNGELNKEELKDAMGYYLPGTNITHASLNRIFQLIDTDGNGGIDYEEFTNFVKVSTCNSTAPSVATAYSVLQIHEMVDSL